MNEIESREQISAFADGELDGLPRDRLVEALYRSAELRREWERLHLIGDAMRMVGPVPGADSLAARVSGALADKRIVRARPRVRRWTFAPLPGLALAASIAAVAILGIRGLDDGRGTLPAPFFGETRQNPEAASADSSNPVPAPPRIAATAMQRVLPDDSARPLSIGDAHDAEARLTAYLVSHSEHAGHGVRGMLPYVRLVAYQPAAADYR